MEEREYLRLKELVETGKKYHYKNFILCFIIFALLFSDNKISSLFLNVLNIELPTKALFIFLYLAIIALTFLTLDVLANVWPHIKEFQGQIDFNWFVLSREKTEIYAFGWVFAPWIISIIGISLSALQVNGFSFFYWGLFSIGTPFLVRSYLHCITEKKDKTGNKLTLSVYLLYWYRILRGILILMLLSLPLINSYLGHEMTVENIPLSRLLIYSLGTLLVFRLLGDFVHRRIDRIGTKWGFVLLSNNR